MPVSVGVPVIGAVTANGKEFELTPPGFDTLTFCGPGVPGNVTEPCNELELTNVVEICDPPKT